MYIKMDHPGCMTYAFMYTQTVLICIQKMPPRKVNFAYKLHYHVASVHLIPKKFTC